jgi:DNA-binding GntR family transcriptional regulator
MTESEEMIIPVSNVASERIAEILAARILAGELAPGERIKQDELAAELQSSRMPVREALRILEARGLVTLRANAGASVMRMDMRDLTLSYQIRERIEPLLLADSLPNLTDADVAAMRSVQAEIEPNRDVERFMVLDRRFHWLAYSRHRAPQLSSMVERLWDTTAHYRRLFTRLAGDQRFWIINHEHRLLVEAIERRDVETASAVLTMHIRRTRLELAEHPEL